MGLEKEQVLKMSIIKKPYNSLSMSEIVDSITKIGDKVTLLVSGEMGIGKSSILKELEKRHPNHIACYVDMTLKDIGDMLLPKITNLDGVDVCEFIPNIELGIHLNKPVIIMLDELTKSNKAVMNIALRLMLERKLGMHALPKGSIVFATGNLAAEGVGDLLPPHARNRICTVRMAKPTPDSWRFDYAMHNDVDPVVIATCLEYPEMFASFQDYEKPEQNPYIFDPRTPRLSFVTPRSMERASDIIKVCKDSNEDTLIHLLIGCVGEAAAMNLLTILKLDNTLPTFASIVASPETAKAPKSGAALCLVVSKVLGNVMKENMDSIMTYLDRLPREAQALFARGIMSANCPKRPIAVTNRLFTEWCIKNGFLFT